MKNGVKGLASRFETGQANNATHAPVTIDTTADRGLGTSDVRREQWKLPAFSAQQRRDEEEASRQLAIRLQAEEQLEADLEFARQLLLRD